MGKKINEACRKALTRALLWDVRVTCLDRWASESRHSPHTPPPSYSELRETMLRRALDGWRDAMMGGLISEDLFREVRQAAADRFLRIDGSVQSAIVHHLDVWGRQPGAWSSDVEERFRDEIRMALGTEPKEEKNG